MKKTEAKTALNIVFLPDNIIAGKALNICNNLKKQKISLVFQLDTKKYRPHITLFQGYYPNKNIPTLIEKLKSKLALVPRTRIEMDDFWVSPAGFVWWNCKKTQQLQEIHEEILDVALPLQEGNISSNNMAMIDILPERERKMIDTTGSIYNRELFSPHITISRLGDFEKAEKALHYLGQGESGSFTPTVITIAHLGEHGTISNTVERIPFS